MKRYLKIYWQVLKLNFNVLVEYRIHLYNGIVNSFVWGGFLFVSVILLTSKISSIVGWSRADLLVLAAMYNVVIGLFYMIFSRNFHDFSDIIHMGRLDMFLTKPVDSQFLLSFRTVNYAGLTRCLIGIALTSLLLVREGVRVGAGELLGAALATLAAVWLLYGIWFIVVTLLIWFSRLSNLVDLLYTSTGFGRYPAETLRSAPQILIFLILPFFLTVSVPSKFLLGKGNVGELGILLVVAFLAVATSHLFWKFALRYYTGASS